MTSTETDERDFPTPAEIDELDLYSRPTNGGRDVKDENCYMIELVLLWIWICCIRLYQPRVNPNINIWLAEPANRGAAALYAWQQSPLTAGLPRYARFLCVRALVATLPIPLIPSSIQ